MPITRRRIILAGSLLATSANAQARTYMVFFDYDRTELTNRARQMIGEAVQAATGADVTRIQVDGHSDSSEDPGTALATSARRAGTVAAELIRLGIPKGVITIRSFGASRPLVPTTAGVREPQNRRAVILLV